MLNTELTDIETEVRHIASRLNRAQGAYLALASKLQAESAEWPAHVREEIGLHSLVATTEAGMCMQLNLLLRYLRQYIA
jgi:hypothetical protein